MRGLEHARLFIGPFIAFNGKDDQARYAHDEEK